jgi:nucleoside-diphosphate-sugar epimerase
MAGKAGSMNVFITGNMGYIGPVVVKYLRKAIEGVKIYGYDKGFFGHCLTDASVLPENDCQAQYFGDVREFSDDVLSKMDAVVMLAAISNDPMGASFEKVTEEINHRACADIAKRALALGVKRVVFASSCSMYGFAEGGARKEVDALNPLTAYARSKVATEQALETLDLGDALVTSLRFSTACGMSPRLRLDLVLNDFVACALASGEITVLSDGTPWRPLIDVEDMARSIEWALTRDVDQGGRYVAVNVGAAEWNYQVRDLAEAVVRRVPGTKLSINTNAPPDRRSYQVDFEKYRQIAPHHQPQVSLDQAIDRLKSGLQGMRFSDANFRNSQFMRLKVLEAHIDSGRLTRDLQWAIA